MRVDNLETSESKWRGLAPPWPWEGWFHLQSRVRDRPTAPRQGSPASGRPVAERSPGGAARMAGAGCQLDCFLSFICCFVMGLVWGGARIQRKSQLGGRAPVADLRRKGMGTEYATITPAAWRSLCPGTHEGRCWQMRRHARSQSWLAPGSG